MCHVVAGSENGVGPNLRGVVGRRSASAPGFAYTPALKTSGVVWTRPALNIFRTAPGKNVPRTAMPI